MMLLRMLATGAMSGLALHLFLAFVNWDMGWADWDRIATWNEVERVCFALVFIGVGALGALLSSFPKS